MGRKDQLRSAEFVVVKESPFWNLAFVSQRK